MKSGSAYILYIDKLPQTLDLSVQLARLRSSRATAMVSAGSCSSGDEMTNNNEGADAMKKPPKRDIRRYYCQYCGICRSKKNLIRAHMLANHKFELEDAQSDEVEGINKVDRMKRYTCKECGASFRKPAHLKQHMQSHSVERPFSCPVDDCRVSYRRKDHLTRHVLTHQGKLFACPVDNCNRKFGIKANMKRHMREIHEDESPCEGQKQYVCGESGCGRTFKYPSKLKKHEEAHVKMDCSEVVCCEPSCTKTFTNAECLKAHVRTCHQYAECEVCGTKQLKRNFKRHELKHELNEKAERIECNFKDCNCTFSNASNLRQHIRAIHEKMRPFTCQFSGCGKKFPYKHVRDKHEKSCVHDHVQGDFIETDERLRSRPRGGRKRKCMSVETLQRKRVVPLSRASVLDDGVNYLRWLLNEH
ncbi:unnamed protein product [Musa banksii]